MVRAPAARTHPPLHGQAAARGDRAGRRARLPALPVRLAAGRARHPNGGARRGRSDCRPTRRVRGAGWRLGNRDPAGAHRRVRASLARRSLPRRTDRMGATAAVAAASRTATAALQRRYGRRRSRFCRGVKRDSGQRSRWSTTRSNRVPKRNGSSRAFGSGARHSSTSWWKARACCARRSKRRWPSWSPWASSIRTVLAGCARC